MKTLIISAIFAVFGSQIAHADDMLHCNYKGDDGSSAIFDFKSESLSAEGVATDVLADGTSVNLPTHAALNVGERDGEAATIITWSSLFDNLTAAMIGDADEISGTAYSILKFDANGPHGVAKGTMTCVSPAKYISVINANK